MPLLTVYIPKEEHGRIVGPGGSVARDVEAATGASLTIPRRAEASDAVVISGSEPAIQDAIDAIVSILGHAISDEPLVTLELGIDPGLYGRIIGPGGAALRALQAESHALIDIPRRGTEGYVRVRGDADAAASALRGIQAVTGVPPTVVSRYPPLDENEMDVVASSSGAAAAEVNIHAYPPGALNQTLGQLLGVLLAAEASIDVCVFTITEPRLVAALIKAAARGVAVRIITDNETLTNEGSDISQLAAASIPVRIDTTPAHMHHKFAVVDRAVALTGSFNWTSAAASVNNENIIVSNTPELVVPFVDHFAELWASFDSFGP
ncbi:phospholipase D6 [Thecamonas trahens ATCC 50062]|uniref:Mitochondrial cardiolipin hydrolase n=1 Tax=Thecamonas trahens ATCC 50062 TaxID=461836 RepID=A0A0L0DTP7_THETB|nr:phospholipase D6 [Thecamonas trahens ATCC 50062]KNC55567.1 phospholipase D6 [Thecamonas trahens ATCC 50062]|eukprot:XP_013761341.1 phospholipase D6 [Thecamonas trahens ATCC 50062]